MEKEDKKENIEISRSFDALDSDANVGLIEADVKMSAFSKRREQESAMRYGGAVGRETLSRHSKL